jgi:hypothetical protein
MAHIALSRKMKACFFAVRKECPQLAFPVRAKSMRPSTQFSLTGRRIFSAGQRGIVGSALIRRLSLMKTWSDEEPINIGSGTDVTIAALARLIADVVGFKGRFVFDASKPDGTPRRLLDVSKLTGLGWRPHIDQVGIRQTDEWSRISCTEKH